MEKGVEVIKINYHLHLKDADIKTDITASEDMSSMPPEVAGNFQMFNDMQASFKIATTNMVSKTFEERTKDLLRQFTSKMSTQFNIPKSSISMNAQALPFRIGSNKSIIIDFETSSNIVQLGGSVSERLENNLKDTKKKSPKLIDGEIQLQRTRESLNDNKHHVLIASHLVGGVISNIGSEMTAFKLEDQEKLQQTVREYFGNDIVLECSNHDNEYPSYRSQNDAIVGEQTVKCSLHPRGYKLDTLYEIDLKLNFNIHPKVDKDGKSLKAEFGNIQATSINTHDRRMEIQASLSDKMDEEAYRQFDPFNNDKFLPFLMNNQRYDIQSNGLTNQQHADTLDRFVAVLSTPGLIDVPQLENDMFKGNLLSTNFRLPVPPGHKFKNPSVKIHPNGVFDISGDLIKE
jgi:hypothetical protein